MKNSNISNSKFVSRLLAIGFIVPALTCLTYCLLYALLWNLAVYFHTPKKLEFIWFYHVQGGIAIFTFTILVVNVLDSIFNNLALRIVLNTLAAMFIIFLTAWLINYIPYRTILLLFIEIFCLALKIILDNYARKLIDSHYEKKAKNR